MFCKKGYYTLTYSPFMKNELTSFFKDDSDLTTFCGQKEYTFENDNDEIIIFNSENKTFPKDKYMHCHYTITIGNITQRDLYLYFDLLKNTNSQEPRNLNFLYMIIFKVPDDNEEVESITHEDLRTKNTWYTRLDDEYAVELFLDFLELNYLNPEEIFKIRLINIKSSSLSSSSSSINGIIAGSVITVVVIIIILGIIFNCCCKGKKEEEPPSVNRQTSKPPIYGIVKLQ